MRVEREHNMFQEGVEPVHMHAHCSNCMSTRRCNHLNSTGLSKCSSCLMVNYCSKECQRSHWKNHKKQCKLSSAERQRLGAETGIAEAWSDLVSWMEYYDTHIKNCALAAFSQQPEVAETHVLIVSMTHQKGPLVPIKHRFNLVTVCIESQDELNTPYHSAISDLLRSSQRAAHREAGKIELGNEFSGIGHYLLVAAFETPTHGLHQPAATMIPKTFSIDKRHARARGFPQWWLLLRSYVEKGQRIKFCCGRIGNVPGVTDDVCCCGGWVHDEEAKATFMEHRDGLNEDLD